VRPLLFDGSPLLASAVFAGADAQLLVGADALRAAVGYPAGLEPNPKRRIDDKTVWLGERELPVVDLLAAVLSRVAAEAARVAGADADLQVVLTHPAAWRRHRLATLAEAAAAAGLGPVAFVPEPVAAAAYFAQVLDRRIAPERCIVVYDLGAGTFDVSVVRPSPSGFSVIAADGLPDVGGLDLDAAVVRHARTATGGAAEAWSRLDWPQQPADQQARLTLWHAARMVKEQLSRHSSSDLYLPLIDRQIHLTRDEFEKAAGPYLERTAALTRSVLTREGVPPEDIAGVFLVGGSSRIPLAATLLHRALRIAPTVLDQPELVVAEGALHAEPAISTPRSALGAPVAPPAPQPSITVESGPPATARPSQPEPLTGARLRPEPATAPAASQDRRSAIGLAVLSVMLGATAVTGIAIQVTGLAVAAGVMMAFCVIALIGSIRNAAKSARTTHPAREPAGRAGDDGD
jgi:molecular chaperone DnaK (HSP70)